MRGVPHAGQHAAHVGDAGDDAGHRVVAMNLVLQVNPARVFRFDQGFKYGSDGHDAFAYGYLALLGGEDGEVLYVHVVEARAGGVNGLDHIRACADRVAHVDAEDKAWFDALDGLEHVKRRWPYLVFRAVVMDRDADVVFLDELLQAGQRCRGRVTGHDDPYACPLAVLELGADVVVFVFGEIDGSGGVELYSGGGVIGQRLGFFIGRHGEMILGVLGVQPGYVELLEEWDHLGARKVAEGVAGYAETDEWFSGDSLREAGECGPCGRQDGGRRQQSAGANEISARDFVVHMRYTSFAVKAAKTYLMG